VNRQLVAGTLSANVFIQGNGGKDLIPLPMLIGHNGTVGGSNAAATPGRSLHQVNPEVETWWKNQFDSGSGSMTFAELRRKMARVYNKCKRGSSMRAPDLILADQFSWERSTGISGSPRSGPRSNRTRRASRTTTSSTAVRG
jgi:hypothetical protein